MKYKISELFIPIAIDEKTYPLNISLRLMGLDKKITQGPGIYLIAYKDILIYVGKFMSNKKGDFRTDRVKRHLEGLTLRGTQCGFNSDCSKIVLKDKMLNGALRKSSKYSKRVLELWRTGAMTSEKKLQFAKEHLSEFMSKNTSDVFKHFTIGYIQTSHRNRISEVESIMIKKYNPVCNKEFNADAPISKFTTAYTALKKMI